MQGVGGAASRLLQRLRRERSGLASDVPIPASHSARRRRVFRKSWYTNHFCLANFFRFFHTAFTRQGGAGANRRVCVCAFSSPRSRLPQGSPGRSSSAPLRLPVPRKKRTKERL